CLTAGRLWGRLRLSCRSTAHVCASMWAGHQLRGGSMRTRPAVETTTTVTTAASVRTTVTPEPPSHMISAMLGTAPQANPPVTNPLVVTRLSGNHLETVVRHVVYTAPAPIPPTSEYPANAAGSPSRWARPNSPNAESTPPPTTN